jgi:hypothetical protein
MYVIGTVLFENSYYAQIITDMIIFNWANNQIKNNEEMAVNNRISLPFNKNEFIK